LRICVSTHIHANVIDVATQSATGSASGFRRRQRLARWWTVPEVRWATAATVLFVVALLARLGEAPAWSWWGLYLACYAAGGWEPARAGLVALRGRTLDVDLLMVAAALGAAAIGQVLDGALLIVIFATSGALEAVATRRTEESVRGLLDLAPETATLLTAEGERLTESAALKAGDLVVVRPGERIPGDGVVLEGASEVDQATITGEPLPVDKHPGDEVFAGTLNGRGVLRLRVTRPAAETVLARIVAMVGEASATKSRTQLFVERVEQRYSLGMVAATVLLFAAPLAFGEDLRAALLRAMTFMIVASPCAVVLATMPPLLAAIANAGRHGVLVKSAVVLERLAAVERVAFDKTGTLTEGAPELTALHPLPGGDWDADALLAIAAGAEDASEHPLGRAVVTAARRAGVVPRAAAAFVSRPGRGVSAQVDGIQVEIGSPGRVLLPGDRARRGVIAELEEAGQTTVVMLLDGVPAAVLGFADRLRPDAVRTITALAAESPTLLTGDSPPAARRLAREAGITEVHAELLPQDKVTAVDELQAGGHRVLLVGDGVNDAPALATAHVGMAMGRAGSDLALDTADAVITRDELATVPAVLALARRARRVVAANLLIAAAFIAVLVCWDLFGTLPLPLGVAGHEGSTVLVGLNGLRLLRKRAWLMV
jgi:heavy metal translocating P-type ATPase